MCSSTLLWYVIRWFRVFYSFVFLLYTLYMYIMYCICLSTCTCPKFMFMIRVLVSISILLWILLSLFSSSSYENWIASESTVITIIRDTNGSSFSTRMVTPSYFDSVKESVYSPYLFLASLHTNIDIFLTLVKLNV